MNLINVYNYLSKRDDNGKYVNGGATYNLNTHEFNPTNGYIVAFVGYEMRVKMPENLNDWQRLMEKYLTHKVWDRIAEQFNIYLGFWIDEGDILVIDIVEKIDDEAEAINTGIQRNQQAIWDANKQQVIFL